MHNQTQFSLEDANMHQKVGTTRIVIEQKNAHAKRKCGYLQRVTPATQFDMLSAVIRVSAVRVCCSVIQRKRVDCTLQLLQL